MLTLWSDGIAQCRACGRIWRMRDEDDTACHGKPSCEVGWRIPHPWDGPMTPTEEMSYRVFGRGYGAEEEVKCPCCGVWVDVIPRTRYGRCTYCGLRIDAAKAEKRGELRGKENERRPLRPLRGGHPPGMRGMAGPQAHPARAVVPALRGHHPDLSGQVPTDLTTTVHFCPARRSRFTVTVNPVTVYSSGSQSRPLTNTSTTLPSGSSVRVTVGVVPVVVME